MLKTGAIKKKSYLNVKTNVAGYIGLRMFKHVDVAKQDRNSG